MVKVLLVAPEMVAAIGEICAVLLPLITHWFEICCADGECRCRASIIGLALRLNWLIIGASNKRNTVPIPPVYVELVMPPFCVVPGKIPVVAQGQSITDDTHW